MKVKHPDADPAPSMDRLPPNCGQDALDTAAIREFAKLGDGLLVWERRVNGR